MSKGLQTYHFLLHFTVFLFGFTGILGRLITVSGDLLVWYRTAIAFVTILLILRIRKTPLLLRPQEILRLMIIGIFVGAHWITFFHAIKISNVSIALACLSVTTLVVAFLEPLFFRTRISMAEVLGGLFIVIGLLLITNVQLNYLAGIITGLASAILSGLFTIFNKKIANKYDGFVISWYEMLGAHVGVAGFILFTQPMKFYKVLPVIDWVWLIILGTICTAFAYWSTVFVLKKLSAYTVVMAINLEPIYGTLMAAFIFNEYNELHPGFYAGSILIILSVFVYSLYKQRINRLKNVKE
ncbi:MAG: DMT family transporter [Flavobacteriales bacterium]|nr:DMT family transporter [Flavobacteriales bacterium]